MRLPIYLDYMATTPVAEPVKEQMLQYLDYEGDFGNPSSVSHSYGLTAKAAVERARAQVAELINAEPNEIIWTSGATEANNIALKGAANFYSRQGKHIITCSTEHKAVLDVCEFLQSRGFEVTYLDPEPSGLLDLAKLERAIRDDTILVSIMLVNNEIGVIQNLVRIAEIVKPRGVVLHCDAAQAAGKIPIDVQDIAADLISFSAHKAYGPKGVGALYMRRKPLRIRVEPQQHGGGHEFGVRSGTLAPHQIVGMGAAFEFMRLNMEKYNSKIKELSDKLWGGLRDLPGIQLNGSLETRVPHNINCSFSGIRGEDLLSALPEIAVSAGSACMTTAITPSHVLKAIGVSNALAYSALRISLGIYTTTEEIEYVISHIHKAVTEIRS